MLWLTLTWVGMSGWWDRMPEKGSWRERLIEGTREAVERRTGYTLQQTEKVDYLEESDWQRRMIQRDLDTLAYTALNYVGNGPAHELRPVERRRLVQRARIVWMKDPQAGAAVDLMNDFVFGRGLQRPKANDEEVQRVIDDFWDDPDNALVLTSFQAQLAMGTDLELQSNLFLLVFEDGQDGKVKLGILDHDTVETVVRDDQNRLRIMYYVARHFVVKWDFVNDRPQILTEQPTQANGRGAGQAPTRPENQPYMLPGQAPLKYYEHWRNVQDALQDAENGVRDFPEVAPPEKLGDGKVFHVALNRGSEMAFGHPRMDRLIRWFNAYNQFMDARVDIMAASAAFVMKRKVKGTPQQLERMANQALSRRSVLGMAGEPEFGGQWGPKAGATLTENDSVDHEPLNLNSNAPNAQQDAQMIRSQISAGTRWPASYYGDASQSNLATATSLELPVLKTVEARQEMIEGIVRFGVDRAIERAVDTGRISQQLTPQNKKKPASKKAAQAPQPSLFEPDDVNVLQNAYEDQGSDESSTERDLGYEFKMPSPLKRMLGDLVLAVMNIAKTFDPNNTNLELSRTLMTVALAELDLEDPAGAVERIFPQGYVDPAVAASEGMPGGSDGQPAPGMPGSPDGQFSTDAMTGGVGGDPNNGYGGGYAGGSGGYGAPSGSQSPEQAMEGLWEANSDRIAQRASERARSLSDELDSELDKILAAEGA